MKLRNVSKGWIHLTVQNVTIPPGGVIDTDPDLMLVRHAIDRGWLKKEPVSVSSEEKPEPPVENKIYAEPAQEPAVEEPPEEILVQEVTQLAVTESEDAAESEEEKPPKKKGGSRKKSSRSRPKDTAEEGEEEALGGDAQ